MLSMMGTFTTPYRPQCNGLCEHMNQMIENKCTVRDERNTWDFEAQNDMFKSVCQSITSAKFSVYQCFWFIT